MKPLEISHRKTTKTLNKCLLTVPDFLSCMRLDTTNPFLRFHSSTRPSVEMLTSVSSRSAPLMIHFSCLWRGSGRRKQQKRKMKKLVVGIIPNFESLHMIKDRKSSDNDERTHQTGSECPPCMPALDSTGTPQLAPSLRTSYTLTSPFSKPTARVIGCCLEKSSAVTG